MVNIKVLKHSESGKSMFCRVTRNFMGAISEVGVGYLYKDPDAELAPVGTIAQYPGEVGFEPLVDIDTGEIRTTADGKAVLQRIVLK
jgi:hypothetical protein